MAFSGESEFANRRSGSQQGGKSNSTPNPYNFLLLLYMKHFHSELLCNSILWLANL